MAAVPAPAICEWQIGDFRVTRILESDTLVMPPDGMLKTTADEVKKHGWLRPVYANDAGEIFVHIQAFIVDTGALRILIDPCVGNDKPRGTAPFFNMLKTPFLDYLKAAGYPAENIDMVLCTHLHLDHVGWNTRLENGRWVPTFPNARYLFAREEYEFTQADERPEAQEDQTFSDSVLPIVEAGLAEIVEFDHHIADGIWLEPSPGHTPGHCSIRLRSKGEEAVITGDMIHHAVQAADPSICSTFCYDEDQARATRRGCLDQWASEDIVVFGTHFANPTAIRVVRQADGSFRFAPAFASAGELVRP